MNVLVTVGTTAFDELVEVVDNGPFAHQSLLQIAEGQYIPKNAQWFRFEDEFQKNIDAADVVVCHGGAGSVFGLLQSGIIPLVVPNLTRRDKHQAQLARWLHANRYCLVAMSPDEVNDLLARYDELRVQCLPFDVKRFFWNEEFNQIVRSSLKL